MDQILRDNASAIFGLVGAIVGAGLSLLGTWRQSRKELQGRLWEKVLDRRIEAHERIVQFSKSLRAMVFLGYRDESGELARAPALLNSDEAFRQWYADFLETFGRSSTWLSTELTRELNFLQDYIVNLDLLLQRIDPSAYLQVG